MGDSSKRDSSEGREYAADPTIVGGRPLGSGRAQRIIPKGIEVLVKKASVDTAFRELLLEKRAAAAAEIGLELSPAEIVTLNSVPRTQIEQIIENTTVPDEQRRVFLGKIATAMLAMLGFGLSGCSSDQQNPPDTMRLDPTRFQGIRPDLPPGGRPPSESKTSGPEDQLSDGSDGDKKESR